MNLIRRSSLQEAFADRATRRPSQIDLSPGEWEEVERETPPADRQLEFSTIASFWALSALLLLIIVATPAIEAAAHHFK